MLIVVAVFNLKMRNIENVITKYVSRVRSVREGAS